MEDGEKDYRNATFPEAGPLSYIHIYIYIGLIKIYCILTGFVIL
jgi:hypothetical protein